MRKRLRAAIGPVLAAMAMALITGGCQLLQTEAEQDPDPAPEPAETVEPVVVPPATMQQAIDLLDTGRTEE
ncbi:MAG: hypothetical protein ACNA7J_12060, partial [Wenzhouxiangella sp.]